MALIFIPIADSVARANNIKAISFLLPLTVGGNMAYVFPVAQHDRLRLGLHPSQGHDQVGLILEAVRRARRVWQRQLVSGSHISVSRIATRPHLPEHDHGQRDGDRTSPGMSMMKI
jgi:hypothetical protein